MQNAERDVTSSAVHKRVEQIRQSHTKDDRETEARVRFLSTTKNAFDLLSISSATTRKEKKGPEVWTSQRADLSTATPTKYKPTD